MEISMYPYKLQLLRDRDDVWTETRESIPLHELILFRI